MSWTIPMHDVDMHDADVAAVLDCLQQGWLTMGPRTKQLEADLAAWTASPHAIVVSSGTSALHLACRAAGVAPGDEVIVPALSFVGTAHAPRYCGAEPVLADVGSVTSPTVDPADVERRITPRTKAVIATHLMGYPADVVGLRALCDDHGLVLIEDATQAMGASAGAGGEQAGTVGHIGCFSFAADAQLCVGEGGMVTSADEDMAAKVRSLRSHAMTSGTWDRHRGHQDSYDIVDIGYNFRLDEPRAALALARLQRLEADIERRRAVARDYRRALGAVDGLELMWDEAGVARSSHFAFPVLLRDAAARDGLQAALDGRGIASSVLPTLHSLTEYRSASAPGSLPTAESAAARHLALPLSPTLSAEAVGTVVAAVREALG